MKKGMKYFIALIFLFLGLLLFGINIYGLYKPLRNQSIFKEKQTFFDSDIVLSEIELKKQLIRNDEVDSVFVKNINEAINKGIAHYWKDEGVNKYNLRIPIYENYILFIASYLNPSKFRKYEYSNYYKAIERGVGLCSQHAIILCEVLENNGINSKVVDISRHVVVTAQVNSKKNIWWVLDPDYGVIIKNDIKTIEKTPNIIRPFYFNKGYDTITVNTLTDSYGKIDNIHDSAFEYIGMKKYYFEKLSYFGIWLLPCLLFITSFLIKKT